MNNMGIRGIALNLFESSSKNRTQVKLKRVLSGGKRCTTGYSVGPILFIIYINYMIKIVPDEEVSLLY